MVAAGAPGPTDEHAARAAELAGEMMDALEQYNERTASALQLRIGIASGTAVAAVIGKRQYLYDLLGDAVAIAARMQSHGVAGRVQLSESTQRLLGESFALGRAAPWRSKGWARCRPGSCGSGAAAAGATLAGVTAEEAVGCTLYVLRRPLWTTASTSASPPPQR